MAENKLIGRVLATESSPTTMDKFCFWTDRSMKLNAFDIVKVQHIDNSFTYGVIENVSHITDAQSFLTNFISSDFGDVEAKEATFRVGMNYVEATVTYNTCELYTPVHNDARVYLATVEEIVIALGLDKIPYPLVCGSLKMYEGTEDERTIPVNINAKFLLGKEGAHLNISGISGLASKTSYAMFLMKAIQDCYAQSDVNDSVAFVIFNVKGPDLMAIDQPNDFSDYPDKKSSTYQDYEALGLSTEPFKSVKYYIPFTEQSNTKTGTYLKQDELESYIKCGQLRKYKYLFSEDKESIEMMFSDITDPNQTIESIISKVIDNDDVDFGKLVTWTDFRNKLTEKTERGSGDKEILVQSWRKFKRIIQKSTQADMFSNRIADANIECRLADELKGIQANQVMVIDIAKLGDDKQAFVFGDALRTIYNLKLGEYDAEGVTPPSRIVIFVDELNKYAGKNASKTSPILRELLDVTERGRSLGVVLFGAEQFRSAINSRITGNCATHAYGRTNSIETNSEDYRSLPKTYRGMLTRLEQGTYLIQNPVFRSLLKIKFPLPIYKQPKS